MLAHFPHGAGESARSAIGNCGVETAAFMIAGGEDGIEDFLFGDGVADLDGVAEFSGMGVGEFGGTEGGAVDAVAAGAAAEGDDAVAGLGIAFDFVAGHDTDAADIDEGVSDIIIVEPDTSVEGGDAHAVAVVTNPGDDFGEDALGREHAGGEWIVTIFPEFRGGDAEDIGGGDGFGG